METVLQITVLGTSVVMAGVSRALAARPLVNVCVVERLADLAPCLDLTSPVVVIFDLAAVAAEEVRPLVLRSSALTWIGVDVTRLQAITFSCSTSPLTAIDDLACLIELSRTPAAAGFARDAQATSTAILLETVCNVT